MRLSCNPDTMLETIRSMKSSNITLIVRDDSVQLSSRERLDVDVYSVRNLEDVNPGQESGSINLPVDVFSQVCKGSSNGVKQKNRREILISAQYVVVTRPTDTMIGPLLPDEERERIGFIGPMPLEQSIVAINSLGDYGIQSQWNLLAPEEATHELEIGEPIATLGYRAGELLAAVNACGICIDAGSRRWLGGISFQADRMIASDGVKMAEYRLEEIWKAPTDHKSFLHGDALPALKKYLDSFKSSDLVNVAFHANHVVFDGPDGDKLIISQPDDVKYPQTADIWPDESTELNRVRFDVKSFARAVKALKKIATEDKPWVTLSVEGSYATLKHGANGSAVAVEFDCNRCDTGHPIIAELAHCELESLVKSLGKRADSVIAFYGRESFVRFGWDDYRYLVAQSSVEPATEQPEEMTLDELPSAFDAEQPATIEPMDSTTLAELAPQASVDDFTPIAPVPSQYARAEYLIKLSADSIGELRRCDVFRVMDAARNCGCLDLMRRYIVDNRPAFMSECDSVYAELTKDAEPIGSSSGEQTAAVIARGWLYINGKWRHPTLKGVFTRARHVLEWYPEPIEKAAPADPLPIQIEEISTQAPMAAPEVEPTNPPIRKPKVKLSQAELDAIDWEAIADRYASGESDRKIAKQTGIPRSTIYYRLRRMGVVLEKPDVVPFAPMADQPMAAMAYA